MTRPTVVEEPQHEVGFEPINSLVTMDLELFEWRLTKSGECSVPGGDLKCDG